MIPIRHETQKLIVDVKSGAVFIFIFKYDCFEKCSESLTLKIKKDPLSKVLESDDPFPASYQG